MTMNSAVLDACVLFSGSLRDFLLRLADDELIYPYWSETIQDEWFRSLIKKRPNLDPEKLKRTRQIMDAHFPRSLVRGYDKFVQEIQLPDVDDRHVLAVAIHVKAKYIVTFNVRDFPTTVLDTYQVGVLSPDDFIMRVIKNDEHPFINTVAKHRAKLTRPPKTVDEYLATLEQQKLHQTVAFLREHKDRI
jgi:predicted nucleic acid-binding protein